MSQLQFSALAALLICPSLAFAEGNPAAASPAPPAAATPAPPVATAPKAEMPFLGGFLRETRIVYPLQIDGWKAEGEHLYEPRDLGVSVRYDDEKHPGRWVDLYFYPAGVLPKDELDKLAEGEADGLLKVPQAYRDVQLGAMRNFSIPRLIDKNKNDTFDARSFAIHYTRVDSGAKLNSAMTFLVDDLYFVKGRMDLPDKESTPDDTRAMLEGFTTKAVASTVIASTGGCWMPVDVQVRPDGMAPPPNRVASMKLENQEVWFLTDKVLVPESMKDSPLFQGKALGILGMAFTGRVFAGCVAPDGINQDVPHGEREIRLVYPSPDANPSSPPENDSGPTTVTG